MAGWGETARGLVKPIPEMADDLKEDLIELSEGRDPFRGAGEGQGASGLHTEVRGLHGTSRGAHVPDRVQTSARSGRRGHPREPGVEGGRIRPHIRTVPHRGAGTWTQCSCS